MIEIDATGKSLGRVASEAAKILMGKDSPDYEPHLITTEGVHISNAAKINMPEKKKAEKEYGRYTGYPGGLKFENVNSVLKKHGYEEIFRRAVFGMLPNNKLRPEMLKKLKVSE
jgi:large subunit ribosomal protein L13